MAVLRIWARATHNGPAQGCKSPLKIAIQMIHSAGRYPNTAVFAGFAAYAVLTFVILQSA